MASYSSKLIEHKFNNLVKAQLAVLFTKEGVEPFVCNEIKKFQLKCLHDICYLNGLPSGTCCSICCTENLVKCPTNRICNVRRGKCEYHRNVTTRYNSSGCPSKICHNFKTEIQNAHRYWGPSYKNSDATQWCSDFWEVAKCFMPPDGYKEKASASETDFNGIISIILNHKDFQGKIHENLNNKINIFEEAREIGRIVQHSSTFEVEDSDLQKYFHLLRQLLSDPVYLATDTHAQNAKQKLMQLENDTLVIGKDDIRKVPDDVLDKMKAGLDEQYDGIELDMIKSKRFKLLSPVSKTAEGVRQILDCADASVRRRNEKVDKAIFRIKPSDKEQTDLAELGETLQKELKTTSKAEKEKHYIDFKQKSKLNLSNTTAKKKWSDLHDINSYMKKHYGKVDKEERTSWMRSQSIYLMSVVNDFEETRECRTMTGYQKFLHTPLHELYDLQNTFMSWLQESPESENIQIFLQDFFIDENTEHSVQLQRLIKQNKTNIKSLHIDISKTANSLGEIIDLFSLTDLSHVEKLYFRGNKEECEIDRLFFPSLQVLTLSWGTWSNDEKYPMENLARLQNLQYLDIEWFTISHKIFETIFQFISGQNSIKELTLNWLVCKEHGSHDCKRLDLDLTKNSTLTKLYFQWFSTLRLNITTPSLVEVTLWGINIDENPLLLSRDMLNIELVQLREIEMSAGSLQNFIIVLKKLPQYVTVKMADIKPNKEYNLVRENIQRSKTLYVIQDKNWDIALKNNKAAYSTNLS